MNNNNNNINIHFKKKPYINFKLFIENFILLFCFLERMKILFLIKYNNNNLFI